MLNFQWKKEGIWVLDALDSLTLSWMIKRRGRRRRLEAFSGAERVKRARDFKSPPAGAAAAAAKDDQR